MGLIKNGMQVAKIVMTVVSLFNLNSIQQTQLNNYAKLQQYQWIERRKSEAEVELMLKNEAQRISGK